MNLYLLVSAIIFLGLGFIWSSKTGANILLKFGLLVLGGWGSILYLQSCGYLLNLKVV